MTALMAQVVAGGSLVGMLIAVIIIAAVFGVVYVALQAMGVAIPPWILRIVGILAVALVAIWAIRLLLAM